MPGGQAGREGKAHDGVPVHHLRDLRRGHHRPDQLNRPETRNAQNRGPAGRARTTPSCRPRPTTRSAWSSSAAPGRCSPPGTTSARRRRSRSARPGPTSTSPRGPTAAPGWAPRSGCCRSGTTSSRTPCAGATCARSPSPRCTGTVYAAGLMLMWACDLIVAADDDRFADVVGTRLGHVRRGVLRPPLGVRPPQDQGADADRRLDRRRGGLPARHGVARCSRRPSSRTRRSTYARRIAKLPTVTALLIKESVNQTVDNMGFYNAPAGLLHPAPAQPLPLGRGDRQAAAGRHPRVRHP